MSADTKVTVYFGPLDWFREQLGDRSTESLLQIAHDLDAAKRQFHLTFEGHEAADEDSDDGEHDDDIVIAESGDYASLSEHVISNFPGFVRTLPAAELHLQNPPAAVLAQMKRTFGATVERYTYPHVTEHTLLRVHDEFHKHLIGQEKVKNRLLAALYPLTKPDRTKPVVLMFYGPSGVGKTETAQFVNGLLGGTLLRKQFSMFHSEKFASYLFGGTHSEASLARDLLDRDSGVILIDEFDKAHSTFHSAFYQLFDGGEFEDKNYHVRVGPALIICTSNYESQDAVRDAVGDALYSRFDAVIEFEHLSPDEVGQVIEHLVDRECARLTASEVARLDVPDIKSRLKKHASGTGNVRQLGKLVQEMISLLLVRSMLAERPTEPTDAT